MNPNDVFEIIRSDNLSALRAMTAENTGILSAKDPNGLSPLMLSIYYGRKDMVEYILSLDPELDLFEASALGALTRVRDILRKEPKKIDDYSPDGYTPLGLASFFGRQSVAEFLVYNGADVNKASVNSMKVAPLHSAAAASHIGIIRLLLSHRADPDLSQQHGWRPLHAAAQNGNLDIIRLLLYYEANKYLANDAGKTPYIVAMEAGKMEAAALLA